MIPEVGAFLLPRPGAAGTVEHIQRCEEVGLSFVGVADNQMLWDDVHVILGAAAVRTSRIRLGPWVTNAITRHETVTANAIATLDDLSGGRAFLGIGYGDSAVRTLGLRPLRLVELRDSVDRMRRLVAGEEVATETGSWRLTTEARRLFVYWAADGPRSLRDAGAYADGVIANGLIVPEHMAFMRRHIEEGAVAAGRSPADVDVVFNTGIAIDDDAARARETAKPYLARTLCHDVSEWMPGWSPERTETFRQRYEYYQHIQEGHRIAELVPDELITSKAVAGTVSECAAQLQTIVEQGFDRIALLLLGDTGTAIRRLGEELLPELRSRLAPSDRQTRSAS